MKKRLLLIVLLFSVFILSGCEGTSNDEVVHCTRAASLSDSNTTVDLKYDIYYKDKYVKRTVSTEQITSSDKNTLSEYESSYKKVFDQYKDIKYYDNTITINDRSLISVTKIDYTKVDFNQILEIEGEKGNVFTKDGKVKLKTLVDLYEKYGSQCGD